METLFTRNWTAKLKLKILETFKIYIREKHYAQDNTFPADDLKKALKIWTRKLHKNLLDWWATTYYAAVEVKYFKTEFKFNLIFILVCFRLIHL
jgi:hypothetical protein